MDEQNKSVNDQNSNFCGCPMCRGWKNYGVHGMHGMPGHFLARLVLGLIILAIVFSLGVKVGEFKGEFSSVYGYHRGVYGAPMMGGYNGYNMMNPMQGGN